MTDVSQLRELGLFDARVPRYTSYPPAPHFSDEIGPGHTTAWLTGLTAGQSVSLYVHVPFCRRLCWFCACRTQGIRSDEPLVAYVDTLEQEIRQIGSLLPEGVTVSRVHLGGGTPTLLPPALLTRLSALLNGMAPRHENYEFSVEIDPSEIDDARLDALVAAGMNRASVGVQDFDPDIQTAIGREQSYDLTRDAINAVRARGVQSVNIDVLYGLPYQTDERIADSMQKVLSLQPDRLALYGYAHVPWMSRRQRLVPSDHLPGGEARLSLFRTASELASWDGYDVVGIDHFARPEDGLAKALKNRTMKRNFQGYTDDPADALIGMGASAISEYPQGYAQNAPRTADYQQAVRDGRLSTHKGHAFSIDDKVRSALIMELLCFFSLSPNEVAEKHGLDPHMVNGLVARLPDRFPGMIGRDGGRYVLTQDGRSLARVIARQLDAYTQQENRHSAAI